MIRTAQHLATLPAGEHKCITIRMAMAGIVSAVRDTVEGLFVQTDAFVHFGNSGGPLLDSSGRVLGIVTFGLEGVEQANFCLAGYSIWLEMRGEPGVIWPDGW